MAGFSKIYCIGGLGGFQGADGINPIEFQIWVGDADRQWLEPHYIDKMIRPLGAVNRLIPEGPDHPNALIDACLAFYPKHFKSCPTLAAVRKALARISSLDFDMGIDEIPKDWPILRREAWPLFQTLNIFEADLHRVNVPAELMPIA
jgi:hypothetical protein